MLEVFDFAGRKLWTHTEEGMSEDGIYRSELEFDDIYRHAAFHRSLFIFGLLCLHRTVRRYPVRIKSLY